MKDDAWGLPLFVHVAVGVFIGTLAAAWVIWRVSIWQVEQGFRDASAAVERVATAAAARERVAAESVRRAEADRRLRVANDQAAEERARQAAEVETARRDAAWRSFYKAPSSCDTSKGGEWTVDCANDHMRAKKRFDALYDAGKL